MPTPTERPITRADLKNMTPAQIVEAKEAGQLDHLLNATAPADRDED